jgi:hypothetical protein
MQTNMGLECHTLALFSDGLRQDHIHMHGKTICGDHAQAALTQCRTNVASHEEVDHVRRKLVAERIRQSLHLVDVLGDTANDDHLDNDEARRTWKHPRAPCQSDQPPWSPAPAETFMLSAMLPRTSCIPQLTQDEGILEHALDRLDEVRVKGGRHLLGRIARGEEVAHRLVALVRRDLHHQHT